MGFESQPQQPPIKPEEVGVIPPPPKAESTVSGPEAPGLEFKDKPILSDVKDDKRIELHPEPPADYLENDRRYKDVFEEASKQYMREDRASREFMDKHGYRWDGDKIVDAAGKEWAASMIIGGADYRRVQEMANASFSELYHDDFVEYEKREKAKQKHVEPPANLPTEDTAKAEQATTMKSETKSEQAVPLEAGKTAVEKPHISVEPTKTEKPAEPTKTEEIKIPVEEGDDKETQEPQEVPIRHVDRREQRLAGDLRDKLGIDHMAAEAKVSAELAAEEALEFGKKSVEVMRRKLGIDDIVDSVKIAWNGRIAGWFERKAAGKKDKLNKLTAGLKDLETDAAHLGRQLKIYRSDGNVSEKDLLRIEADRQRIEGKIGGTKQAINEKQASLNVTEISRRTFESRRDEAGRTYVERARAELEPFEDKISDLKNTREQLDKEVSADNDTLKVYKERMAELQAKIDAERFPSIRKADRAILKKVQEEARFFEREIRDREKHKLGIDKQIAKAERRAAPFRGKIDKMSRIMRGKPAEAEKAQTRHETEERPATDAEQAPEQNIEQKRDSQTEAYADEDYSDTELVEAWNELNGSKMMINPETFKEATKPAKGGDRSKKASINDFWSGAQIYSAEHGDSERMEGMPSMTKAAEKKRSYWRFFFGIPDAKMGKKRLLEQVRKNRAKEAAQRGRSGRKINNKPAAKPIVRKTKIITKK
ncbi:MAG: hypothetical protein KGI49_01700 [Patescibacteria group bacterium]|nr:hypothetical protein [Patescibacteria group bacterium]